MNVGRAITQAMRDQRRRDLTHMTWTLPSPLRYHLSAYVMWGWNISGQGGLGKAGWDL